MKIFFTLLLLTNIVFALVQWLFPYDQFVKHSSPIAAAEKLKLLDELDVLQVEPMSDKTEADVTEAPKPEPVMKQLCYTLGPFKSQEKVQEVTQQFNQYDIPISPRPSIEKEYLGMMVFLDGHDNRKQAIKTAESLRDKGVKDYIIYSDETRANALSLGVFGLKKNADRRMERVSKLGYKVKSEPRYRNRTIYWLDYSTQENDGLKQYVEQLKSSQGISRISRQCS